MGRHRRVERDDDDDDERAEDDRRTRTNNNSAPTNTRTPVDEFDRSGPVIDRFQSSVANAGGQRAYTSCFASDARYSGGRKAGDQRERERERERESFALQ